MADKTIPCARDCPDRNCRCHIECEKYKEWHENRVEKLRKIYQQKNLERNIINYEIEGRIKRKKRCLGE